MKLAKDNKLLKTQNGGGMRKHPLIVMNKIKMSLAKNQDKSRIGRMKMFVKSSDNVLLMHSFSLL